MKTTLLVTLLSSVLASAQAQDFRVASPAEPPNAEEQLDKKAVALVTGFLNDLANGQFEAARQRMAEGFVAYGPGYDDKLETDNLLNQWERNGKLFTDQHLTIEITSTTVVPNGDNRGLWVYVKGIWSATDGRGQGKPIRIPFHQLARVSNDRIERTYTSYGTDQFFYDLGFTLYNSRTEVMQKR